MRAAILAFTLGACQDSPAGPRESGADISVDNASSDRYLNFHVPEAQKISYARTIWFKGELYLPKNPLNDPNWRDKDIRKLLDWQGGSDDGWTWGGARWYLARMISDVDGETMVLGLSVEKFDSLARVDDLQYFAQFGGEFATDTWHTIEVRMTTNSAEGIADGVIELYIDNPGDTPSFRATGLTFISEKIAPLDRYGVPRPGSYFNNFLVGSQLSNNAPLPFNREYRYWDNIAFGTTRIPAVMAAFSSGGGGDQAATTIADDSVMALSNFDDGTYGPFAGTKSFIDFPDDPTNSGRGKVARILYAPRPGD